MYGKFAGELKQNKGMQDEFKGFVDHEAKTEFRRVWALDKSRVCQKKVELLREQGLTTPYEVHCQYRSFKIIWDEEGTDLQGYQAALKYVAKAKVMGGKWTSYNQLTERLGYQHFTQHTKSIFTKRWSQISTQEVGKDRDKEEKKG